MTRSEQNISRVNKLLTDCSAGAVCAPQNNCNYCKSLLHDVN